MKRESIQAASGVSLPTVVFIVFLTLKLTGSIRWSWLWVTSPIWLSLSVTVLAVLVSFFVFYWRNLRTR